MSKNANTEMRDVIVSLLDIMYDLGIDENTARVASSRAGLEEMSVRIGAVIARAKAVLAESESNFGNEASMRASLNNIHLHLSKYVLHQITDTSLCLRIKNDINSALKEPARNCDVYKTKDEAQKAFLAEACENPCGNCTIKDINNECGVKWLFAEHKGKAKK